MRNARHVIAVTLMATAICADRALPASPVEVQSSHLAGRLMERLSLNLRRVVRVPQLFQARRLGPVDAAAPRLADLSTEVNPPTLSPFEFRLPPPLV